MKRIFVNWELWECYKSGMYRHEPNEEFYLKEAIELMSFTDVFGIAMHEVVKKWKHTMRHHLTNTSLNRRAFIGQCACSYLVNCPESIVRIAWKNLSEKQRNDADLIAEKIIKTYVPE